jgi:hypothetical protein
LFIIYFLLSSSTTTLRLLTGQISFPLQSTTLRELKLAVSKSERLGRIPTTQQRMFHLGKELKAHGQVLSDILMLQQSGVVHVHATPPKEVVDLAEDDEDDDDDDDDCVLVMDGPTAASSSSNGSTTTSSTAAVAAPNSNNNKRRRFA